MRAQEEMMGHVNEQGVFVRPRRAGAEAALEAMKDGAQVQKSTLGHEVDHEVEVEGQEMRFMHGVRGLP